MQKIKQWASTYIARISVAIVLILAILGCAIYFYDKTEKETAPVTELTQEQSESVNGIQTAADNAKVPISTSQAKEAAQQIKEIRTTEQVPVYVVQSTGATVQADVEQARQKNDADFAIVTSKDNTEEKADLSAIDNNAHVELNQYNVQAYKKQLNTISYAPAEKVIGYEHAWKISKSGHYVGIGVDHDLDDNKTLLKVVYSW